MLVILSIDNKHVSLTNITMKAYNHKYHILEYSPKTLNHRGMNHIFFSSLYDSSMPYSAYILTTHDKTRIDAVDNFGS